MVVVIDHNGVWGLQVGETQPRTNMAEKLDHLGPLIHCFDLGLAGTATDVFIGDNAPMNRTLHASNDAALGSQASGIETTWG